MTPIFRDSKQAAQKFGQAAAAYHAQAQMQKNCAKQLLDYLPTARLPPTGSILEIGCGTGFITQELVNRFGDRLLEITDLSLEMLHYCRSELQIPPQYGDNISFRQLDGEARLPCSYAMIVSGFAIQWFQDPIASLRNWLSHLQPGGFLLISFPTCRSFPEWRQVCTDLNLPFTANPLPNADEVFAALKQSQSYCSEQHYELHPELHFETAADFFKDLKAIGAGCSQTGKQLSVRQMRQLIRIWNERSAPITVTFHITFGVFQR